MDVLRRIRNYALMMCVAANVVFVPGALASSDHGGGSSGNEPLVFVINGENNTFLRFGIILEAATPEASHEISVYKPKIQHEIILLMSGKNVEKLRTLEAKKALVEEIIDTVNHVIHANRKKGVKEVLFTTFIIQ